MSPILRGLGAAVLASGLWVQPAAAEYKRITTQADYVRLIAGKRQTAVAAGGGHIVASAQGRVNGQRGSNNVFGRWMWHETFWCRNVDIGGRETGTDCFVVEFDGAVLRLTANFGRGATETFRVQ